MIIRLITRVQYCGGGIKGATKPSGNCNGKIAEQRALKQNISDGSKSALDSGAKTAATSVPVKMLLDPDGYLNSTKAGKAIYSFLGGGSK